MEGSQSKYVVLSVIALVTWLVSNGRAAAQNRVFVSTSLEGSQASYVSEFSATTGGTVDKFRLTFPAGTLGAGVGLVNLQIGTKPAKTPIVTGIDPLDPNALLLDVPKTVEIARGVQLILELMGLTNPTAGDYQIGIELIGKTGSVLETLTPIPFSIAALAGGGDITAVNAGTGLSGGGTSGDVTLNVNPSLVQNRVAGSCAAGNAVRVVNQDGTVTCESVGDIKGVTAGTGLAGGATSGEATLSVAAGFQLPQKCASGQVAKATEMGVWTCAGDTDTLGALVCAAGQTVKFNGSAWVCNSSQSGFVDNGVGTITDNRTGLMWEKKTGSVGSGIDCSTPWDCADPSNVNNYYKWSDSGSAADGPIFTDFLAKMNCTISQTGVCGAGGHTDWRIPTIAELQTILLAPFPCGPSLCIDPIFGPTWATGYWSSTTDASGPLDAWLVGFQFGHVFDNNKDNNRVVRAVRGGR